ncbi:MAG TPA: EAL domain-containing protein [Ilumatobacteraceae bacterium]|nr:EAL domain-containing protein [Ilumatobacteraceae bacterium]HRB04493.1 EAL domain-containing protein [Ilumatobacteraceae bacterium]
MKRASALLTWWYLATGGIATVVALALPWAGAREALYIVAAIQLVPVMFLSWRRGRVPARVAGLIGVVGLLGALAQLVSGDGPTYETPLAIALGLLATCCIMAGLVVAVRVHGPHPGLVGDSIIVALGSWIISWVMVVRPIVDNARTTRWSTFLYAMDQPSAAVVLFLVLAILLSNSPRWAAMWLVAAGLSFNLLGNLISALVDVGRLADGAERIALPLHIAACFSVGAAFLHPSIARRDQTSAVPSRQLTGRLIVTIASLVLPVVVLAATAPSDGTDKIIRSVSALILATIVTVRVAMAVRINSRAQAELLRGAQTDPLTGLPNRTVLLERINELLGNSWSQDQHPTLFFVDLDRFKNINDSLGHAAGDEVLVTVAKRLINLVPAGAMVARLSGDEYVVLDTTAQSPSAALALAERMLAVFREPLAISQGDVFVTASIGVAGISSTSSTSPEDLVRHADTAMYRAKDAGRNCLAVYDESMHERVAHRLAVETALYRALDRHELRLFHQPILDLQSGDVVGFEALMRWQQSDGTMVPPAEFIPIAEDTGTIVPIGSWALLEALSQLRRWINEGVCSPSATMSVNVSPRQLSDANFPAIVSEALTRSGVAAQLLWLEVTESVMISEPELALATLRRLRSLGVRVALDDFGTGYSSLSLLQKFPLQRIKIDRAFVHGVADNPNDRSLVRTIIAMGRSLGLDMVAEGVESVHQLQVLSDLGCTKAQGYLISHPVPADAMRSTVAALERLGQFPGLRPTVGAPTG